MRVRQWHVLDSQAFPGPGEHDPHRLVLAFGSVARLEQPGLADRIHAAFPGAVVAGCSTAGEITAEGVSDDTLTLTEVRFERTRVAAATALVPAMADSERSGEALAQALSAQDLSHVFVLSDGVHVNGSALVAGLTAGLPAGVTVTGGLAGDGGRFTRTLVLDGGSAAERRVVAVGLYGRELRIGHGSLGGWEAFGPIRRVTRAEGNVVHELDGRPALEIYESYLGEQAAGLPASGLLFPLALVSSDRRETGLIRTLLAVDRASGALTFAGNVPQGGLVRLMHASFDRLIDASGSAAGSALASTGDRAALAILISCVGRRLLLGSNTEEEVEAAALALGRGVVLSGFYSNGEISPFAPTARCELHNQTMTVTTLGEAA